MNRAPALLSLISVAWLTSWLGGCSNARLSDSGVGSYATQVMADRDNQQYEGQTLQIADPKNPATHVDRQIEAKLTTRILAEIGEARCSHDSQCRTLPLGEKACGGPTLWLPWSSTKSNPSQLSLWAHQLAALQRKSNALNVVQSNCQYLPDPGAMCLDSHCVALSSAFSN